MHESSIVLAILKSTDDIVTSENLASVEAINIVVGRLHQIVPEFMNNVFHEMKKDYPALIEAVINLEVRDVRIKCNDCQAESTIAAEPIFICPHCNGMQTKLISGDEMYIKSIEATNKE